MKNKDLVVRVGDIYVKDYSFISSNDGNYIASYYYNNYYYQYEDFDNFLTKLIYIDDGHYIEQLSGVGVDVIDFKDDDLGECICSISKSKDILSRGENYLFVKKSEVRNFNKRFESRLFYSSKMINDIKNVMFDNYKIGEEHFNQLQKSNKYYKRISKKRSTSSKKFTNC